MGGLIANMLPENQYYQSLQDYIQNKYNCIACKTNKGHLYAGLVDVVGVYETSGRFLNDVEIVVVEVKKSTSNYGKYVGQILGYSIYGERCYLAVTFTENDGFTPYQKYIANHLGVGLIRVPVDSNGKPIMGKIETILTSKKHDPIPSLKEAILFRVNLVHCSLCGIHDEIENMNRIGRIKGKPALFVGKATRNVYLCKSCFNSTMPEKTKVKFESKKASSKKAILSKKRKEAARKAVHTMKQRRDEKNAIE